MCRYRSITLVLSAIGLFLFNCTENPINTDSTDQTTYSVDIKGKVLDKDNNPLVGATAKLIKLNLTATTNDNGEYLITGNKSLSKQTIMLAKSLVDTSLDTLVIEKSGSEIQRTALSSLVSELPTTYIIQREIRGTINQDDNGEIGKIIATVADKQYPTETKSIELWYDKMNKAFHSFAYFYYANENRTYVLNVNIYDTLGHIIGKSQAFEFPNNAGNLDFTEPIVYNNTKPEIIVQYPYPLHSVSDTVTFSIIVRDMFDGKIVSCLLDTTGNGKTIDLLPLVGSIEYDTTTELIDSLTGRTAQIINPKFKDLKFPTKYVTDSLPTFIRATDNDGNTVTYQFLSKMNVVVDTPSTNGKTTNFAVSITSKQSTTAYNYSRYK